MRNVASGSRGTGAEKRDNAKDRGVPTRAMSAESDVHEWDYSTHEEFYEYYARASQSEKALDRFRRIKDVILRVIGDRAADRVLDVADIGCGAGTQSIEWAQAGHSVHALDVNGRLVQLARERAVKAGSDIDFRVGSATDVPWGNESMDVCIALELLEHVADWESCVNEFVRILRPGGLLFMTTTNRLCPRQEEFNLPLYSWYPRRAKRHFEKLALTTRPAVANFAKYPAVNWFTFYQLQAYLSARGFVSLDRFDMMDLNGKGRAARMLVTSLRSIALLRLFGQICTSSTRVLALKTVASPASAPAAARLGS
jgi:2-polyprenyl-6-hydroxyphenyl methylase/3-demethylubiquinone-9 3-methyltransferase